MKKLTHLVPAAAVLAATLATPSAAAADPICASVGYSLLGGGTDIGHCVGSSHPTGDFTFKAGDPNSVQVRVNVQYPITNRDEQSTTVPAAGNTIVWSRIR